MAVRCGSILISLFALLFLFQHDAVGQPEAIPGRPDVYQIGEPFPITRPTLALEMRRNDELKLFITEYGWPDYAEIQEVLPLWPWADYEVRLYYLDRDVALAYGRVFLSPSFPNYGMRKSAQRIDPDTLHRLLTARPIAGKGAVPMPPTAPQEYFPPREPGPAEEEMESGQPAMGSPVDQEKEPAPDVQIQTQGDAAAGSEQLAQQPAPASE